MGFMSVSEKLSIVGDLRKALQDFLAPELVELKAQYKALLDGQRALLDGQKSLEDRVLREIKNSEEKLLLRIQLAEANLRSEQSARIAEIALRENEQLRREKAQ